MTSYVKMIDVWLLFNLVVPFVEVNFISIISRSQPSWLILLLYLGWSLVGLVLVSFINRGGQ